MSQIVITNALVKLNAVDESANCTGATIDYKAEVKDVTPYGSTSHKKIAGLTDWSVKLEFDLDFANSANDGRFFALVGTVIAVEIAPVNSAASTSNPHYKGNGIVEGYTPIAGKVGDAAKTSMTISCADGVALIRATS